MLAPGDERAAAELQALWPLRRFPVLVDEGRTIVEATIIIEHLGLHHPGPVRLIPEDARAAPEVRMMDRFFDNYVATPVQKIVLDGIRAPENRDGQGVAEARAMLGTAYRWLDGVMAGRARAAPRDGERPRSGVGRGVPARWSPAANGRMIRPTVL